MKKIFLLIPLVLTLAGCTHPGGGQGGTGQVAERGRSIPASADAAFLRQAAQAGIAEVAIGQLATQRGQSQAVRNLGQALVQDHTQVNQRLMQLAQTKNVQVPRAIDAQHQKIIERLSNLPSQEFDETFRREAISMHKQDIQLFEQTAQQSPDAEIRAFAANTLPVLRQHLDLAQSPSPTGTGSSPRQNNPNR